MLAARWRTIPVHDYRVFNAGQADGVAGILPHAVLLKTASILVGSNQPLPQAQEILLRRLADPAVMRSSSTLGEADRRRAT